MSDCISWLVSQKTETGRHISHAIRLPGLNKGDKITIEQIVNGKPVGFYLNPEKPAEPQVFVYLGNGELKREEDYNASR